MKGKGREEKGQIHTLEGFMAGFIILLTLIFSLQSIGITPTSSSTASQAVELHNYKMTDDLLSQSEASGDLKDAILYWNETDGRFGESLEERGSYAGRLANTVPDTTGSSLNRSLQILHRRGVAHNIHITCGGTETRFVYNGQPSKHAVTASVMVPLYEQDDVLINTSSGFDTKNVTDVSGGFINENCDNLDPDTDLYNVLEVEITAWRM